MFDLHGSFLLWDDWWERRQAKGVVVIDHLQFRFPNN